MNITSTRNTIAGLVALVISACATPQGKAGETEIGSAVPGGVTYLSEQEFDDKARILKTFSGDFSRYSALLADAVRKLRPNKPDFLEEFADDVEEQAPQYLKLIGNGNVDMHYMVLGDYGRYHFLLGFNTQGRITHLEMFVAGERRLLEVYRDHPTVSASVSLVQLPDRSLTYESASESEFLYDELPKNIDEILKPLEAAIRSDLQQLALANRNTPLPYPFVENDPAQLAQRIERVKVDYNAMPGVNAVQTADKQLRLEELIRRVVGETTADRGSIVCLSSAGGVLYSMALFRAIDKYLGIERGHIPGNDIEVSYKSVNGLSDNRFARVIAVEKRLPNGSVERKVYDFGEPKFTNRFQSAYNLECGVVQFEGVREVTDITR